MKKNLIIGLSLLIPVILPFFITVVQSNEYSAGKELFKKNCQFCHQQKGDDNYPSAYYQEFKPKDFSKHGSLKGLDEGEINQVITKGKGVMPAINLKPEEKKAIIDFMARELKK